MAKDKKGAKKNSRDRDLDKKMKVLSKALAKQVSIFYKGWFRTDERSSLRKVKP